MRGFLSAVDRFFYEPKPVLPLAVYRVLLGSLLFANGFFLFLDRHQWFGIGAPASSATPRAYDVFRLLPPADPWLALFFALYLGACAAMILGAFTRQAMLVAFIGTASLNVHTASDLGDTVVKGMLFLMLFSRAGDAWSASRPPWAQRLMQIYMAYIYFDTFVLKMANPSWRDGTFLREVLATGSFFRRFDWPWLYDNAWLMKSLTWGTLAVEGLILPILIWFAPTRRAALCAGLLLHLGIQLTMSFQFFELIMIFSLVLFVEDGELRSAWKAIRRLTAGRRGLAWSTRR